MEHNEMARELEAIRRVENVVERQGKLIAFGRRIGTNAAISQPDAQAPLIPAVEAELVHTIEAHINYREAGQKNFFRMMMGVGILFAAILGTIAYYLVSFVDAHPR